MKQIEIMQAIVAPMMKNYSPPQHLKSKDDVEIARLAGDLYGDALRGFTKDTLGRAWKAVVADHKGWGWPPVGEITKACREVSEANRGPEVQTSTRKWPWEVAEDKAQAMRDEFMGNCSGLPLSREAMKERWYFGLSGLYAFFNAHATLQAQVISGVRNIRYEAWTVGYGSWIDDTNHEFDADVFRLRAHAKKQGRIEISVPAEAVTWMKKRNSL